MKKRYLIFTFTFFFFSALAVFSQENTPKEEGKYKTSVSKGVLNGSAVNLVKPPYPVAAKAVRAEGTVSIQVTIDEQGNVISAQAVSGHPLLQAGAVQAALQSKFKPTLLQGQPVKVTGIIVYNFIAGTNSLSVRNIGYLLSFYENSARWSEFSPERISTSFPEAWVEEKEILKNIDAHLRKKAQEKEESRQKEEIAAQTAKLEKTKSGDKIVTVEKYKIGTSVGELRASATLTSWETDAETVENIRSLQSRIENRLSAEEKNLWSFRFGKVLGKTRAEIDSNEKTQINLIEINQMMQNSPYQFAENLYSQLREITESFQQSKVDFDARQKTVKFIESLAK